MEAIEGSILEMKESFIKLLVSKIETKCNPEAGYLFSAEANSSNLHIFCISKQELKTYRLDLTFSQAMGFHHVGNSLDLGGGTFDN